MGRTCNVVARVAEAVAAWSLPVGEVDERVLRAVQQLKGRLKIALVTNATSRLSRDLEALGLRGLFDVIVNSSEIGFAKPEHGFYWAALRSTNVTVDQALFVDDSRPNVEAATQLGIRSLQFTGHESLMIFLRECGVLGSE